MLKNTDPDVKTRFVTRTVDAQVSGLRHTYITQFDDGALPSGVA
jgi:hypothetical protein